jgi:signal peptidase II
MNAPLSRWLPAESFRNLIRDPMAYLAALVVLSDQVTKNLLTDYLPLHAVKTIIPGFLDLVHVRNTGAAFSLLAGAQTGPRRFFFVTITILALLVMIYLLGRTPRQEVWTRRGLVLILGGALGNLLDRLRYGEVIDFLHFHLGKYYWPAFNVADSAITVGAGILLVLMLKPVTPTK